MGARVDTVAASGEETAQVALGLGERLATAIGDGQWGIGNSCIYIYIHEYIYIYYLLIEREKERDNTNNIHMNLAGHQRFPLFR